MPAAKVQHSTRFPNISQWCTMEPSCIFTPSVRWQVASPPHDTGGYIQLMEASRGWHLTLWDMRPTSKGPARHS